MRVKFQNEIHEVRCIVQNIEYDTIRVLYPSMAFPYYVLNKKFNARWLPYSIFLKNGDIIFSSPNNRTEYVRPDRILQYLLTIKENNFMDLYKLMTE